MTDLYPRAWEHRWPAPDDGMVNVRYHGHNAVADYRAEVHPEATSRALVYEDEARAEIDRLQAEIERLTA